jgi:hypothetical protein
MPRRFSTVAGPPAPLYPKIKDCERNSTQLRFKMPPHSLARAHRVH